VCLLVSGHGCDFSPSIASFPSPMGKKVKVSGREAGGGETLY
jgi:hypothetical protein